MARLLARTALVPAILAIGLAADPPAHAQTTTVVQYFPGWNMAGAPPGTDLSGGVALYVYGPNGYTAASDTHAVLCQGYWLDANAPDRWLIPFTGTPPASDQTCPLQAGWNLIGNPFLTTALLPSGTIAVTWSAGRYEPVNAIPLGGAVWIYTTSAGSVVLHPAPSSSPAVVATVPSAGATYQLHVGETIEFTAGRSQQFPFVLGVDPHYLALTASGSSDGAPIRSYRAEAAGTTAVDVTLNCYYVQPACLAVSIGFTVNILP